MLQKFKNIYHLGQASAANLYYRFPGRKLIIIGVTGTDGKTTTTNLIYHIFKTADQSVSLVSTVGAVIHGKTSPLGFHVTNPASWPLQKFLSLAAKTEKKTNYLVLEVTSHGIDQKRIWGIPFTIAGLTNISHEHLDYHKTYDNYLHTKAKLLRNASVCVINTDDKSFPLLQKELKNKKSIITYGFSKGDVTVKNAPFVTIFKEQYNQYNALLATAICRYFGLSDQQIKKGIQTFVFPKGRTEIVYKKDFTVMIDFAHTPNAFEKLLPEVKKQTKGKLIHVFGSAGLRDNNKRPIMGAAAATYDDVIILTSEDPRTEKVESINAMIRSGMNKRVDVLEIPDRQRAIEKAIAMAKKGDFVLITGKGHEASMNYGNGEEAWNEFEAVERSLKK